ncbi:glycosyl transferase family 1 [Paenibacillus cellulosilyticus]|uniref:Glycosyl transferase family 1 n=1 Tax=Paenibacillus cellulosilyticus TaxID=375489 RepID=A0A2V2YT96_9BACL|nr:glycosyltransferase [Paenibacillus cellulosilyticus]PWW02769.1 glycosyl transferase family 1 [Paenibacillus cellulosilyticus]QKS45692.1 glycosyltransferase family 1 protein [Paenibacillus cellulosilyticus]
MNKLNVLFITEDFSRYVQRSIVYLCHALADLVNLTVWHEAGPITDILQQLRERPDYILLNDLRKEHTPLIDGLANIDIPLGAILHDPHFMKDKRKEFYNLNHVKHIFTIYRDPFLKWYPEFVDQMHWFPHFAETAIFRDYKLERDIDFMLLGCTVPKYYPLRKSMLEHMRHREGFFHREHPGYRNFTTEEDVELLVDRSYALAINRAKIFLSCDSIFHYPLRKYFEVLACRTLLLAPASQELFDLGFVPGIHFVDVTEQDYEEKADYYLMNEAERRRIADAGFELIHGRHSVKQRAKQFFDFIQQSMQE